MKSFSNVQCTIYLVLYILLALSTIIIGELDPFVSSQTGSVIQSVINMELNFGMLAYFVIQYYISFKKASEKLWQTIDQERSAIDNYKSLNRDLIKSENELLKTKDLLEQTGNIAEIGGWEVDLETMKLTWTDEVYRICELETETKIDLKSLSKFYHTEEKKEVAIILRY